jgi:hypothetical protein
MLKESITTCKPFRLYEHFYDIMEKCKTFRVILHTKTKGREEEKGNGNRKDASETKQAAKRPNEHDNHLRRVWCFFHPAALKQHYPMIPDRDMSPVCASQIVCQFPNANCAILVSRQNRFRKPPQAHAQGLVSKKQTFHVLRDNSEEV